MNQHDVFVRGLSTKDRFVKYGEFEVSEDAQKPVPRKITEERNFRSDLTSALATDALTHNPIYNAAASMIHLMAAQQEGESGPRSLEERCLFTLKGPRRCGHSTAAKVLAEQLATSFRVLFLTTHLGGGMTWNINLCGFRLFTPPNSRPVFRNEFQFVIVDEWSTMDVGFRSGLLDWLSSVVDFSGPVVIVGLD